MARARRDRLDFGELVDEAQARGIPIAELVGEYAKEDVERRWHAVGLALGYDIPALVAVADNYAVPYRSHKGPDWGKVAEAAEKLVRAASAADVFGQKGT